MSFRARLLAVGRDQCFFTTQMKVTVTESAESETVAVTCALPRVAGLPEITPDVESIDRPAGRPTAWYARVSVGEASTAWMVRLTGAPSAVVCLPGLVTEMGVQHEVGAEKIGAVVTGRFEGGSSMTVGLFGSPIEFARVHVLSQARSARFSGFLRELLSPPAHMSNRYRWKLFQLLSHSEHSSSWMK